MENNALGKGLSALIPQGHQEREKIQTIPLNRIKRSGYQPRHYFSNHKLAELSQSIKEQGVLQPILLRAKGDSFEIIAGERRCRAAEMAGLTEVPAIVRQVDDNDHLQISLIENIQREELSRVEEAKAYKRLADEFGLTHEKISQKVSKDRTTISNMLRVLELPQKIQDLLDANLITLGHAKTILSLETDKERVSFCDRIIREGLSVRQSENIVKQDVKTPKKNPSKTKDVHLLDLEEKLQQYFGTRIKIQQGRKRGKISIEYFSPEDLQRVLDLIPYTKD